MTHVQQLREISTVIFIYHVQCIDNSAKPNQTCIGVKHWVGDLEKGVDFCGQPFF